MIRYIHLAFLFAAMLSSPTTAWADIITQPAGLSPGDQYRLAFVTSTSHDSHGSDIGVYNTFVSDTAEAQGALAALGTNWTAIASTIHIDARDNTATEGIDATPIYLLNGVKLADSYPDLWDGTIDSPLNIDEKGNSVPGLTWTGTKSDGTASDYPIQDILDSITTLGSLSSEDHRWIEAGQKHNKVVHGEIIQLHYYGISGTLTATVVPEPSTKIYAGLVGLGVAGWRRVRTRRTKP